MLTPIAPTGRARLRPLFDGLPGLHGCLDAALDGGMGEAFADDANEPAVARVLLDFDLLGGDASAPAAIEAARAIEPPASIVPAGAGWETLLRRVWGEALGSRTRVAFRAGGWQRERLRGFIAALPEGFTLRRIGADDVGRFEELADSLVYNFPSPEAFVERGAGFGVEHDGRFVAGCSSFAISPRSLEFEIQTHPDYRRRGLATAAASAMIEHCLERGLEPCWDAHNEVSAALATKLGFVEPRPYTAYELGGG